MKSNDDGENDTVKGNNNKQLQMIYGGHILYRTKDDTTTRYNEDATG
jgi:hypothetical protein